MFFRRGPPILSLENFLGMFLIFAGFFIILTAKILTGGVIGTRPENYLGMFGLMVMFLGFVFVFMAKKKANLVEIVSKVKKIRHF